MTAFLMTLSDNQAFVLTYEEEKQRRTLYEFRSWAVEESPTPFLESADDWLEQEGSSIEAVYPIDLNSKTIQIQESSMLEYTELLDEIRLY